jgi:diaminohydroxyphosphoribosylaminopyrimidine deaminase/5-amino-6-(5-phosphoribosylamino)uracil reductase
MISFEDSAFMARALRLARRGLYTAHPNPRVGCVLVKAGQVVGEGYHRRTGESHAERIALSAAGEQARGATAYTTLEPCCHQGRTPPCVSALLDAEVERVVAAMEDPNPLVAGRGLDLLRAGGVAVEVGLLAAEARALNPGFIKRMCQGLPFVRCKLAMSLDGRTAMASGESRWITHEAARRDVQFLRAQSSAIVTGIGTVLNDDPSLNVRLTPLDLPGLQPEETPIQPVRVVVDSRLRLPPTAQVLRLPGQTLVACIDADPLHAAALEAAGARLCRLPERAGRVDLTSLFAFLAAQEINEVLLEAGHTLAGAALQAGLIDEFWIYLAPHLMGDGARGLFHLPGLERMDQRIGLEILDVRPIGRDWRIRARLANQVDWTSAPRVG